MVQRHLAFGGIGGDHLAAQFVHFEVLARGGLRLSLLAGVAPGQHNHGEQ